MVVVPLVGEAAQRQLPRGPAGAVAAGVARLHGGAGVRVAPLLLGDVGLGTVHGLHVLAQGAGVRVALGAARDFADVRFLQGNGTGAVNLNHPRYHTIRKLL